MNSKSLLTSGLHGKQLDKSGVSLINLGWIHLSISKSFTFTPWESQCSFPTHLWGKHMCKETAHSKPIHRPIEQFSLKNYPGKISKTGIQVLQLQGWVTRRTPRILPYFVNHGDVLIVTEVVNGEIDGQCFSMNDVQIKHVHLLSDPKKLVGCTPSTLTFTLSHLA